ncbi:MAG: ABC transporter permease [Thermoplasmatales archaeon]|nr:ABC transporter permease [Thermoplasmatales archaeon]
MTNVRIDKERMEAVTSSRPTTRFKDFMSKLWKHKKGKAGLIILFGLVIFALIGHFAAPYNPLANNAPAFQPPSHAHLLGTDYIGQDILSWFMVGTGTSLVVGFTIAILSALIGVTVGVIAGYFGGKTDDVLMRAVDVLLVIPGFPLLVILQTFLPPTLETTVLILSILGWPFLARVIRSQTLTLKERQYVLASKLSGLSGMQIIFRDIIPMLIPIITINAIFIAVGGVVAQAGLAFFGLGDLRSVNWGTELYYFFNQDGIAYKAWWWLLPPGIGIIILGLGANFLSNGIFETTKPQKGG